MTNRSHTSPAPESRHPSWSNPRVVDGRDITWHRAGRVGVAVSDRRDARGNRLDVEWTNAGKLEPVR